MIWSKRRTCELSSLSRKGGANGSKIVITGGGPVADVRQEVEGRVG
jgi:hypothetical protein